MELISELPRYFYCGVVYFWWWMGEVVPHLTWEEYRRLVMNFIWLLPLKIIAGIIFPERVIVKNVRDKFWVFRKNRVVPSKGDHQTAAAAASSVIHHL